MSALIRVLTLVGALAAALALCTPSALAGVANAGVPGASASDPLAGLPWGNYDGPRDEVFPSYWRAAGARRELLGLVALRPRVRWFGAWYPDIEAKAVARGYVDNVTGGNSNVLAQMAVFRLEPWEEAACHHLPTPAQQASYRTWTDRFAAGIGAARVALILQPDLPFAICAPHHSHVTTDLVAYAARVFSALPHTTVYIDAGAGDWASAQRMAEVLRAAGVRYVRGFALNATHYDTTSHEIQFGARLVRDLAAEGFPGRHFVVNTADNGRGFTYQEYRGPNFNNAAPCTSRLQRRCVTLGIPPTTDVADPHWGLPPRIRALAASEVDAYLWVGRPWLYAQADPFQLSRTLQIAATSPFGPVIAARAHKRK